MIAPSSYNHASLRHIGSSTRSLLRGGARLVSVAWIKWWGTTGYRVICSRNGNDACETTYISSQRDDCTIYSAVFAANYTPKVLWQCNAFRMESTTMKYSSIGLFLFHPSPVDQFLHLIVYNNYAEGCKERRPREKKWRLIVEFVAHYCDVTVMFNKSLQGKKEEN